MSGTITFDDEFNTLSLHRTWQQGDNWQLIAPDSTDGRGGPNWGEGGTQWWVNPFNPNTPINGIYSVSNGMLNLRSSADADTGPILHRSTGRRAHA